MKLEGGCAYMQACIHMSATYKKRNNPLRFLFIQSFDYLVGWLVHLFMTVNIDAMSLSSL